MTRVLHSESCIIIHVGHAVFTYMFSARAAGWVHFGAWRNYETCITLSYALLILYSAQVQTDAEHAHLKRAGSTGKASQCSNTHAVMETKDTHKEITHRLRM